MQRRNLTRRQQGFTTVELMLAVALVAILTLAIFGAASAMRRSFAQNTANNYNLLAAKKGLSRIAEELRYGRNISIPASGVVNSPIIMFDTLGSAGNTISNTIVLNKGLSSLQIVKNGIPTRFPAPLVQSVTFTRNNSRITVNMVVKDTTSAANPTLTLSTTVRMLNVAE